MRRSFLKGLLILPFAHNLIELIELEPAKRIYAPAGGWILSNTDKSIYDHYAAPFVDNFFAPNPLWEMLTKDKRPYLLDGGGGIVLPITSRIAPVSSVLPLGGL